MWRVSTFIFLALSCALAYSAWHFHQEKNQAQQRYQALNKEYNKELKLNELYQSPAHIFVLAYNKARKLRNLNSDEVHYGKASFSDDKVIITFYEKKKSITEIDIAFFRGDVFNKNYVWACRDTLARSVLADDLTLTFIYFDKNEEVITSINLQKDICEE